MYFEIGTISDVPVYRFPFWLNLPNILFFVSNAATSMVKKFPELVQLLVISQGLVISPVVDYGIITRKQGGITCGAIDDPRKSSKAIDERVIINFRDKNVVIARFRDKNVYR